MDRTYWLEWEKFLQKKGLKLIVRDLITNSHSLVILISQLMVFGVPFFRGLPQGRAYMTLVETLGDHQHLEEFSDLLMEVGG